MEQTTTIKFPRLEPWQNDLFTAYQKNPKGKIFVTKSIRQVGKSATISLLLIYASVQQNHSKSKAVSPIWNQAAKLYDDTVNLIPSQLIARKNSSALTITLINGSYIEFSSAESGDNLRGYTVKGSGILAIDEAAYVIDDTFYGVLLPMTNVNRSDIFIFSTPERRSGFFFDLYMQGLSDDPKCVSFDWADKKRYDTSKYLDKETLEIYRQKTPANIFKSQFLGEWLDDGSGVFGDISHCLYKPDNISYKSCYFGIDWGSGQGQDYTVITVMDAEGSMLACHYFNDKDETATIQYIVSLARKWQPRKITVETNSIGQIYYGLLQKAIRTAHISVQVNGFTTTNESKDKIISRLQVAIQNSQIRLIDDEQLRLQFSCYEMTFSKAGKRVYNGKTGVHDDIVMATAICYNSITNGNYNLG